MKQTENDQRVIFTNNRVIFLAVLFGIAIGQFLTLTLVVHPEILLRWSGLGTTTRNPATPAAAMQSKIGGLYERPKGYGEYRPGWSNQIYAIPEVFIRTVQFDLRAGQPVQVGFNEMPTWSTDYTVFMNPLNQPGKCNNIAWAIYKSTGIASKSGERYLVESGMLRSFSESVLTNLIPGKDKLELEFRYQGNSTTFFESCKISVVMKPYRNRIGRYTGVAKNVVVTKTPIRTLDIGGLTFGLSADFFVPIVLKNPHLVDKLRYRVCMEIPDKKGCGFVLREGYLVQPKGQFEPGFPFLNDRTRFGLHSYPETPFLEVYLDETAKDSDSMVIDLYKSGKVIALEPMRDGLTYVLDEAED